MDIKVVLVQVDHMHALSHHIIQKRKIPKLSKTPKNKRSPSPPFFTTLFNMYDMNRMYLFFTLAYSD
jgi:hypothetical protein